MKYKIYTLVCLTIGIFLILFGFAVPAVIAENAHPISVIGGSDAPTVAFWLFRYKCGVFASLMSVGISMTVTALFCIAFKKSVVLYCNVNTSLLSLFMSALCTLGISCFLIWMSIVAFDSVSLYPIEYPCSVFLGLLSFMLFCISAVYYFKFRSYRPSLKGILIDIASAVIFLPSFFFVFSTMYKFFQNVN